MRPSQGSITVSSPGNGDSPPLDAPVWNLERRSRKEFPPRAQNIENPILHFPSLHVHFVIGPPFPRVLLSPSAPGRRGLTYRCSPCPCQTGWSARSLLEAAVAAARRSRAQRGSPAAGSGAAAMAPAAGSSLAGSLPWGPPPAGHTQQTVRGQRVSQGADPTFMALNGGSLWRPFISAAQTEESSKHLPDDWG